MQTAGDTRGAGLEVLLSELGDEAAAAAGGVQAGELLETLAAAQVVVQTAGDTRDVRCGAGREVWLSERARAGVVGEPGGQQLPGGRARTRVHRLEQTLGRRGRPDRIGQPAEHLRPLESAIQDGTVKTYGQPLDPARRGQGRRPHCGRHRTHGIVVVFLVVTHLWRTSYGHRPAPSRKPLLRREVNRRKRQQRDTHHTSAARSGRRTATHPGCPIGPSLPIFPAPPDNAGRVTACQASACRILRAHRDRETFPAPVV